MTLFQQVYQAFTQKKINHNEAESLELYFDVLHDQLWQHSLDYGKRSSSLGEETLKELYRETWEYLQQRFQDQDIDIKEIHIENSQPVIEKFVSAFIFIFQRRIVKRIKRQNRCFELIEELLEEFEKHGLREPDPDIRELTQYQGPIEKILQQEKVTKTGQLALEFILEKLNTCMQDLMDHDMDKIQEKVNGSRISQVKHLLNKKRITNRKALEKILLLDN
ncbi:MAG: hypothetical protein PVH61_30030 [Candidatus Aminicenantes bacterium]|jgi:hypothetical protein